MPKKQTRQKHDLENSKKDIELKGDGTEYALVVKMLGNGRLEANCFDGVTRLGLIRGKLRKRVWIHPGDLVLVSLRDFEEGKCDVLSKYTPDEARILAKQGEIPQDLEGQEEKEDEVEFDIDAI